MKYSRHGTTRFLRGLANVQDQPESRWRRRDRGTRFRFRRGRRRPGGQDAFYASKAIASGNLAKAEQILQPASYSDARDPARLINLATVYAQTQRFSEARATLERVRQLPDEVLLAGGPASPAIISPGR